MVCELSAEHLPPLIWILETLRDRIPCPSSFDNTNQIDRGTRLNSHAEEGLLSDSLRLILYKQSVIYT